MLHSFNPEVAKECGILAATIFHHITYWCDWNEKNEKNLHDGKFWTYNSKKAFAEQFYYVSEKQVRTALQALRDAGFVECGNYNKSPYDRTLWYAITDKGQKYNQWRRAEAGTVLEGQDIGPTGPIGRPEWAETLAPKGRPIPDIKPYKELTDIEQDKNIEEGATPPDPHARTRKPKEPKATKESFGEYQNVKLTINELNKLKTDYGEADTEDSITYLDEYLEEKGTKYKSHYLTIRRWVMDAVREKRQRQQKRTGGRTVNGDYDWESL